MTTLADSVKLKGSLSEEVIRSEFFRWWATMPAATKVNTYLGSDLRDRDHDRIFEAYLKSQAVGPNGIALLLSGKQGFKADLTLREFFGCVKALYPNPLGNLIDILEVPVKKISGKITEDQINEVEEAIKILVRLKQGGKRVPMSFEGVYHDTSPGHSKFWSLTYVSNNLFRASWGKIGGSSQGTKDYTESEARELVRKKTTQGNYRKQR